MPVIAPLFRLDILHPPADFAAVARRLPGRAADQRQRRARARRGERAARPADPGRRRHHRHDRRGAGLQRRHLRGRRWRRPCRAGAPAPRSQGGPAAACLGRRRGARSRRDARAPTASRCAASPSTTPARRARCPIRRGRRCRPARSMPSPSSRRARRRLFAKLLERSGPAPTPCATSPPSPSALPPSPRWRDLPFKATVAAARPTRQAVLDEIDRLAEAGVQGQAIMSDTPSSPPPPPAAAAARAGSPRPRRGRRLHHRRGRRRDRAGRRGDLAAFLARTGAGAVARPGGHPGRADARHRPADGAGRRRHRRQRRGRGGPARAHRPSRRSRKAPARGIGDRGRTAGRGRPIRRWPSCAARSRRWRSSRPHRRSSRRQAPTQAAPSNTDAEKEIATLHREIATLQHGLAGAQPGGRRTEGRNGQAARAGQGPGAMPRRPRHGRAEGARGGPRLGGDRRRGAAQRGARLRPALRHRSRLADAAGPG